MLNRHIAAAFTACVLLFASSPAASAHSAITGTTPSDGTVTDSVTEISVTANEELLDLGDGQGFVIAVTDAAGNFYGDGCTVVDRDTASMPVILGESGEYTVAYRIVSADGHPIEGTWSFTYSPAPDTAVGDAFAELPVCGESQAPVNQPEQAETPTVTAAPTDEMDDVVVIDIIPIIGLSTIPLVVFGIWLLIRSLGKRDSEDHLT